MLFLRCFDPHLELSLVLKWRSAQTKEVVPIRPKTPLVDTRNRPKTPSMGVGGQQQQPQPSFLHPDHHHDGQQQQQAMSGRDREGLNRTPVNILAEQFQNGINFHQGSIASQHQRAMMMNRSRSPGRELDSGMPSSSSIGMPGSSVQHYENGLPPDASYQMMPNGYPGGSYESDYGQRQRGNAPGGNPYTSGANAGGYNTTGSSYSADPSSRHHQQQQMDYG